MRKFQFHPCGNFRESYLEELAIFETDFGRLWLGIGLVLLFGVIPFITSPFGLYILNTIGIYAIAAIGLNLLIGYTGQISLGHGAFFGVGAYTGAILATKAGIPFVLAIPAAGLVQLLHKINCPHRFSYLCPSYPRFCSRFRLIALSPSPLGGFFGFDAGCLALR